jgi:hypothetical protein
MPGYLVPVTARGHFPPEVDSGCDFFIWFREEFWEWCRMLLFESLLSFFPQYYPHPIY